MRHPALVSLIALATLVSCSGGAPAPATPAVTPFVIPTRSPAPSVVATVFAGTYGFLVPTANGYALRREADATPLATLDLANVSVSPDGRFAAGWTRAAPSELRIVYVAVPRTAMRIATLSAEERGLFVAWSADGSGLVYSVAGSGWSAVRRIDVTPGATPREIARIDGVTLRPALWDRLGGDLVGAFIVDGDLAREYVVIRGTEAPQRKAFPDKPWHATVSGDERWILIAAASESTYRTFQADDPSFIVETHALTDAPVTAIGRPMRGEIGVALDRQLILWDPATGLRARIAAPDIDAIVGFRFDGSAAIVRTAAGLALIDVASAKLTPLLGDAGLGIALP